jgi:glycosyltransferase involved in cell wall biosynthesis
MTAPAAACFAVPGDIAMKTGGFIYERHLLEALRQAGREVRHLQLPGSFPEPGERDMAEAVALLRSVPGEMPLILDGLVFGAIETAGLAGVSAPVCAMIHHPLALEAGLSQERAAMLRRRERDNLSLAAHVLVPSRHTTEILRADYAVPPERIAVAPPGFRRVAAGTSKTRPPLILSVGILHPRKGHDTLLSALAMISDLDWEAEIVGPAYDRGHAAALRRQRSELGLEARVAFAGEVPEDVLLQRYGSATIFALATRYEGYGMVLAEALCHGLPVVSCRAGAVPDTLPAEAGLLVPPDDPPAFAAALRRMLTDGELRAAAAAASAHAGAALPDWDVAAGVAGAVLDRLAGHAARNGR